MNFLILPNDCIDVILTYLNAKDLYYLSQTCSILNKFSNKEEIWKELSLQENNFWEKDKNITWKEYYCQTMTFFIYRYSKYDHGYHLFKLPKELKSKKIISISKGCFITSDHSIWIDEPLCNIFFIFNFFR